MSPATTFRIGAATAVVLALTGVAGETFAGPSGGALPPVLIEQIDIAGRFDVPADAEMVAANVTAVAPSGAGHVTVYPCADDVPDTSNLNYVADAVVPNLTLTRIAADGTICIATFAVTDVVVDIVGYVPAGSAIAPLATPVRFFDSRTASPDPIPAGTTTEIPIAGVHGVADDATTVMFNLTAIGGDRSGHLTAFPCGEDLPETSSVNYTPGLVVPNLITSRIGVGGAVCIHSLTAADIIVDVTAAAASGLVPLPNSVRIHDTRPTGTPVAAGDTMTIDIAGRSDVPDTATAAVYNLTAVEPAAAGFATSHPCDIDRPLVSNLNFRAGQVVANATITKLSTTGELCIYTLAATDLVIDLIGYVEGTTDYVALEPTRILDTREGWQPTCDWVLIDFGDGHATVANTTTSEIRRLAFAQASATEVEPVMGDRCDGVHRYVDDIEPNGVQFVSLDRSTSFSAVGGDVAALDIRQIHSVGDRLLGSNERGAVIDTKTDELVWGGVSSQEVRSLAISRTGLAFVPSNFGDAGELWDMEADQRLPFAWAGSGSAAFSPDGRYLAIEESEGVVVVTIEGQLVDRTYEQRSFVQGLGFSGAGTLIICVWASGLVRYDLFTADQFPIERIHDIPYHPTQAEIAATGSTLRACSVG